MMYGFENIWVMTYTRICNMASLVLACAYSACVWIGRSLRREVLAEHLARVHPLRKVGAHGGGHHRQSPDVPAIQLLPGFAKLFDADDG